MKYLIIIPVLFLCGCALNAHGLQDHPLTYQETFLELQGDCGPLPYNLMVIYPDRDYTTSFNYQCQFPVHWVEGWATMVPQQEGGCYWEVNNKTYGLSSYLNWSSDQSFGSGYADVSITTSPSLVCQSHYSVELNLLQ